MPPRPGPDLDDRRRRIVDLAEVIAEREGWSAVTIRRLATELGATQPVLYSAFGGRQELVDAVALQGFDDLADALERTEATPAGRMAAYLAFAAAHPRVYKAMFDLPSGLTFAAADTPEPLRRAFASLRAAFADADDTRAEVAWATVHGLASLQASGRIPARRARARLRLAAALVSAPDD